MVESFGRLFFKDWAIAFVMSFFIAADGVVGLVELLDLDLAAFARISRWASWSWSWSWCETDSR